MGVIIFFLSVNSEVKPARLEDDTERQSWSELKLIHAFGTKVNGMLNLTESSSRGLGLTSLMTN